MYLDVCVNRQSKALTALWLKIYIPMSVSQKSEDFFFYYSESGDDPVIGVDASSPSPHSNLEPDISRPSLALPDFISQHFSPTRSFYSRGKSGVSRDPLSSALFILILVVKRLLLLLPTCVLSVRILHVHPTRLKCKCGKC